MTLPGSGADASPKYELGEEIAEGGMGAILSVRDTWCRRTIAMKVLKADMEGRDDITRRFIAEGQITAQLEHPNIVPVHELSRDEQGRPFYTMKMIQGHSLDEILTSIGEGNTVTMGDYPLNRLLNIFLKVCDAVAFAHSRQVIHRDLKPDNVMVGDFGEVLVVDWGIAKVLGQDEPVRDRRVPEAARFPAEAVAQVSDETVTMVPDDESLSMPGAGQLTQAGSILGTPSYMPPEQAHGFIDQLDARTDIYSLGAILYEILTLRPPADGGTAMEALMCAANGEIRHPGWFNADDPKAPSHLPQGQIPDALAAVAMKALAYDRADRYQHVEELQAEIEAYLGGFATRAENAGFLRQCALLVGRHKAMSATIGIGFLLVVAVITGFAAKVSHERNVAVGEEESAVAAESEAESARQEAETNLALFLEEQAARRRLSREAAPEFLTRARKEMAESHYDAAEKTLRLALALDPKLTEAWYHIARIQVARDDIPAALESLAKAPDQSGAVALAAFLTTWQQRDAPLEKDYQRLKALSEAITALGDAALARQVAALAGRRSTEASDRLSPLDGKLAAAFKQVIQLNHLVEPRIETYKRDHGYHIVFRDANLVDFSPVAKFPLEILILTHGKVNDLSCLRGQRLTQLHIGENQVHDLSPLAGMPLVELQAFVNPISDLSPLAGMPLRELWLQATKVSDLSPLAGMDLRVLRLAFTPVSDLSPLRGMQLRQLDLRRTQVTDLSLLEAMPLEALWLPPKPVVRKHEQMLRHKQTLKELGYGLNLQPADEFWTQWDAEKK